MFTFIIWMMKKRDTNDPVFIRQVNFEYCLTKALFILQRFTCCFRFVADNNDKLHQYLVDVFFLSSHFFPPVDEKLCHCFEFFFLCSYQWLFVFFPLFFFTWTHPIDFERSLLHIHRSIYDFWIRIIFFRCEKVFYLPQKKENETILREKEIHVRKEKAEEEENRRVAEEKSIEE